MGDSRNDVVCCGQGSQNLGRLHVGWKTSVGEAGSVQSQPVVRKVDPTREVVVAVEEMPTHVTVGTPFTTAIRVTNNSPRPQQLQLQFRKHDASHEGSIYCASLSHQVSPISFGVGGVPQVYN